MKKNKGLTEKSLRGMLDKESVRAAFNELGKQDKVSVDEIDAAFKKAFPDLQEAVDNMFGGKE